MTKNLILEIEFHNCGELGLDCSANVDWRIYDDLSLEINIVHGGFMAHEKKVSYCY